MAKKTIKVGKYQLLSKIGEGGMGAIYIARHPTLNKNVILKQLKLKGNSMFAQRFAREARIVFDFRDEHVVQVYDHFKAGTSYFIVMEYVDGIPLDKLIQQKKHIPNETAILIFREICKGLKYAHDKNVIHRDIKPANIIISKEGKIKLTDFGIATSKEDAEEGLTRDGTSMGTPAYMSPEQIDNSKTVDKRADIYSMGVLFYEMLTGKCPFPGTFTPDSLSKIYKGKYTRPRKINREILPALQRMIKKTMHHKPKKRYPDLEYLIIRLSKYLKKYKEQNVIDSSIKSYITPGQMPAKTESQKQAGLFLRLGLSKIIFIFFGIACILGGTVFYVYYNGLYFEYLKPHEYGALRIAIKSLKRYKNPDEIYINAHLLKKDSKAYIKVDNIQFKFNENKDKETKSYYYLNSKKFYAPSDNYRLQLFVENKLYTEDFYLNPRAVQKKYKRTRDEKPVLFVLRSMLKLPLKIKYSIRHIESQRDITIGSKLAVYSYAAGRWQEWNPAKSKKYGEIFTTGKKYIFKFSRTGYYPKTITTYIKPNEVDLNFKISLIPVRGMLYIQSNYEGLDILINNSLYYFEGGIKRKYSKLSPTAKKTQKIYLSPGVYLFTVRKSKSVLKTKKIVIRSNKLARITVNYNAKNKTLNLR